MEEVKGKLRVFEAFAGIGSQAMALRNLGLPFEVVGISEVDRFAVQSYEAIHGSVLNYGDISEVDWSNVPDFDLLTYSFPCTDVSISGRQGGFEKGSGTSSSLLWECEKAIREKKPKVLLMENVKALLSSKFIEGFYQWVSLLRGLGYTSYYGVLNGRDFGVPQNRERVFMVSFLGEHKPYKFPTGHPNNLTVADLLEDDVPTSYYAKDFVVERFVPDVRLGVISTYGNFRTRANNVGQHTVLHGTQSLIGAVLSSDFKHPKYILTGLGVSNPAPTVVSKGADGYLLDGLPLIALSDWGGVSPAYTSRVLTEREYWRLMGFSDGDFQKAKDVGVSKTQLYKQAGNSIVVGCLEALFREIYVSLGYSVENT